MKTFAYCILSLFGIVVLLLLASNLIFIDSQYSLTFTSMLDFLSSQNFDFSFHNYIDYSITSDWLVFNFLRDFFNLFITITNYGIYLVSLLLQLIRFSFSCFQFFFFR